jgi:biopolymer transport protein ExbD
MNSGLSRPRRKKPEMNLLPLIDVLVMLIFFSFVTMQFRSASTLNITLPKVETAGKNEFKGSVTLSINKEGVITFNGTVVSDQQLIEQLRAVKNIDKDIPVLIKADEDTPLKKLTFVWDACRKVGLNKHSLQSR